MEIEDIRRVEFRPGDKIVLRSVERLSVEQFERISGILNEFAPGIPHIILDYGLTLDVLSEKTD